MRFSLSILPLFLLVFTFSAHPTNNVSACGGEDSCCKKEPREDDTDTCCKTDQTKQNPCKGDKKGCPCPYSSSNTPSALPDDFPFSQKLPAIGCNSKAAWYFLNKIPPSVYLSVWLPPKI